MNSSVTTHINAQEKGIFLMKPSIVCTLVAVVFLFVGLAPRASGTCANPNSILHATYGWESHALGAAGNTQGAKIDAFVPFVQVGHITFDGNGNFSGAHDTNFGGGLLPHGDSGTYSVNSDCTTGTVSFATGVGFKMNIVITSGGQEIKYVGANTGNINSGTMRLMAASCSGSILSGNSFGYATDGLVGAGSGNSFPRVGGFVPFAHGGQISFGADGSISGVDNASFGGVLVPGQPVSGTYSVNSDCTGTTTMTIAGVDNSWHFVILQDAGQIIFVATPTGYVWAGTLSKF
jgi:hypothetical protein